MNGIYRLSFLLVYASSANTLCNLPSTWLGSWYQRGMSSLLEITNESIQTKGHCLHALPLQQYYLFSDGSTRCTRCLLFIERHRNLLQYRESECIDPIDFNDVHSCPDFIAPDASLYTLHRNNSQAQLCPIQAPYRLTRLIKDGSTCRSTAVSTASIGECANSHQFRLSLPSCSSYQNRLDLEFVCVGTWVEGFHTYFVTRILSATSKNQYTCFHFRSNQKDLSSSFVLSMSSDDSCRDLTSNSMSTTMTLSSTGLATKFHRNSSCVFSDENHHIEWISLNQTQRMTIHLHEINLIDVRQEEFYQRFDCLEKISTKTYRVRHFSNCDVQERCIRVERRTSDVLELIIGDCYENFDATLTFTKKTIGVSFCPTSIGHLQIQSIVHPYQTKINYQMSVGCDHRERVLFSRRNTEFSPSTVVQIEICLASWQSEDSQTTYLITRSIYSNRSFCLSFQMDEQILIRNDSRSCSTKFSSPSISYSATLIHRCSHSSRFQFNGIFSFIFVFVLWIRKMS